MRYSSIPLLEAQIAVYKNRMKLANEGYIAIGQTCSDWNIDPKGVDENCMETPEYIKELQDLYLDTVMFCGQRIRELELEIKILKTKSNKAS
jgi:hypothetical protein